MPVTALKSFLLLSLSITLLVGCATSTVESRKKERYGTYSQLTPEVRALVDQGQIKVGMPMEAVYIAWGKPSQILQGETPQGPVTTWIYHGTYLQEYRYWTYRGYHSGHRIYHSPYLEHDYYPRSYVQAEVTFENGVVKQWRTLPSPEPY